MELTKSIRELVESYLPDYSLHPDKHQTIYVFLYNLIGDTFSFNSAARAWESWPGGRPVVHISSTSGNPSHSFGDEIVLRVQINDVWVRFLDAEDNVVTPPEVMYEKLTAITTPVHQRTCNPTNAASVFEELREFC